MQIAKWGNSLAVRLPSGLIQELGLKAGDEVEVRAVDARTLELSRDQDRARAIETLKILRKGVSLPADTVFNREALHERDGRVEEA